MKLLTCILLHAGICFNTLSQTTEDLIKDGKKEFASGNYLLAVGLFDKVLKIDPDLKEINFLAGLAEFNLKNFDSALTYLNAELKNNKSFVDAYILRAKANKHSFIASLNDLDTAQELSPNSPQVFLTRADLYFEQKEYKKAYADYSMLLKSLKTSDETVFKMGLCKYYLNDPVSACELWKKVEDPDDFKDYELMNKVCNK